jgi:phospholipase C
MLDALEQAGAKRRVARQRQYFAAGRPDPSRPERTDCLPEIQHIVVLMMENHSYDNYLGTLGRGDGFPRGPSNQPTDPHGNRDSEGALVPPWHLPSTKQHDGVPAQTWNAVHIQFDGGALDGFPRSVEATLPAHKAEASVPMGYFDASDLPFYHGLASTFPLATRWFCSCLGPTFPNRRFLISGTAHGLIDDTVAALYDEPPAGTIFDLLSAHRVSWANYHNKLRPRTLVKSILGSRGHKIGRFVLPYIAGVVPGLEQLVIGTFQFCVDLYPRQLLRTLNHALPLQHFFDAAAHGTLPSISIVDPDYSTFSEEDPQDVRDGEGFSAAVVDAVMRGPGWQKTLLIWLYDEHGGYYDHVVPPRAVAPDDVAGTSLAERFPILKRLPFLKRTVAELELADAGPRTYDNLGFRVPAVVVSPYGRRDFVSDRVYDHTSILKLIELKWNLPSLTRRDAAAEAPLEMLDLGGPPPFIVPPDLPPPAKTWIPR